MPTAPVSASPTQAAAPSNPHRRQPSTRSPAGSFLGAFGCRPSVRADGHHGPASETLHHCRPCERTGDSVRWVGSGHGRHASLAPDRVLSYSESRRHSGPTRRWGTERVARRFRRTLVGVSSGAIAHGAVRCG
jgi:hypothetical protein